MFAFAVAVAVSFVAYVASAVIAPAVCASTAVTASALFSCIYGICYVLYLLRLLDWFSASTVDDSDWIIWLLVWCKMGTGL